MRNNILWLSFAAVSMAAYQFPAAKQGVTDYTYSPQDGHSMEERYQMLNNFGLGIKIYNLFWSTLESTVASSTSPLNCPSGTVMVPASASDMLGFHQFHCYNQAAMSMFDTMLALDQKYNFQSAAVIWSAPEFYRAQGCLGFDNGGYTEYGGCLPNDGVMDQYEDYINFLANRYNGREQGRLVHFIIWNEVASGGWFDYSPVINTNQPVTDDSVKAQWVNKYVDLLTRAHTAVTRWVPDSLVHVSLDMLFESGGMNGAKSHIGGKTLLDGVWQKVGNKFSWSVAIHPYGEPDQDQGAGVINFYGLRYLTDYQRQKLQAVGAQDGPQMYLLCSEQGWFNVPLENRADNMCKAHNIIQGMSNVIGTTHNYFEATSDSQDGTALIPHAGGFLIANGANFPTYLAYISTGSKTWGQRDDHYCCQRLKLGCKA